MTAFAAIEDRIPHHMTLKDVFMAVDTENGNCHNVWLGHGGVASAVGLTARMPYRHKHHTVTNRGHNHREEAGTRAGGGLPEGEAGVRDGRLD